MQQGERRPNSEPLTVKNWLRNGGLVRGAILRPTRGRQILADVRVDSCANSHLTVRTCYKPVTELATD